MKGTSAWLSVAERDLIVDSALRILATVGMRMAGARALDALEREGARVDRDTGVVRFSEDLVRRALGRLPDTLLMAGATPELDVILDRRSGPRFNPTGCIAKTLDFRTGERRASSLQDLREGTIVMDATPELDIVWTFVTANDVPVERRELLEYYTYLTEPRKPIVFVDCPTAVTAVKEIAAVLGGGPAGAGLEGFRVRPRLSVLCAARAPLEVHGDLLDVTCELAALGAPVWAYTMPIAGATSPVTIAGTLALMWAELLGLVTVIEVNAPGAPVLACCGPGTLDMRTTNMAGSAPETTLISVACVEIGHHLGLPVHNAGVSTDAKAPGMQAGYEKGLKALPTALAGADVLSGGFGGIENSNTFYLPMVPIDAEIATLVRRLVAEVPIDPETVMLDAIERVGIGGDFLKEKETRRRIRAGEHFMPQIGDRLAFDQWAASGRSEVGAAVEKIEAALAAREERGAYLSKDQRAALADICGVEPRS